MQQCLTQVQPNELRLFMPPPSFQENNFYMQPNILLPPLKVKQPAQHPTPFPPFPSMPPLTTNNNATINTNNLGSNSVHNPSLVLNLNPNPHSAGLINVHNYNNVLAQPQLNGNLVYTQPNAVTSSSNASDSGSSEEESEEEVSTKGSRKVLDPIEKKDLKERNRIAAQKWRKKKDKYLTELESANDVLRQQALSLCGQMQSLRVENKLLEDELQFFQSFMSKIMNAPKH